MKQITKFEDFTIQELKEICKIKGIEIKSNLRKSDLVDLVKNFQNFDDALNFVNNLEKKHVRKNSTCSSSTASSGRKRKLSTNSNEGIRRVKRFAAKNVLNVIPQIEVKAESVFVDGVEYHKIDKFLIKNKQIVGVYEEDVIRKIEEADSDFLKYTIGIPIEIHPDVIKFKLDGEKNDELDNFIDEDYENDEDDEEDF